MVGISEGVAAAGADDRNLEFNEGLPIAGPDLRDPEIECFALLDATGTSRRRVRCRLPILVLARHTAGRRRRGR